MIQFVYPLVPSKWGQEIRYSLRSLDLYFRDTFQVLILGEKPSWMTNVSNVNNLDRQGVPTDVNMGIKYKWCAENLSGEFVFLADDVYLLKSACIEDIKLTTYISDLNLVKIRGTRRWQKLLWSTYDRAKELGYHGYNFETHLPKYIEVDKLKEVIKLFQITEGKHLLHQAYYSVFPYNDPIKETRKVGYYNKNDALNPQFGDAMWLNHDDNGLTNQLKTSIISKFQTPSKFERAIK